MSVSAILQQMAENAGRAQLARGNTYASLVAGASQIPAQIMDDRERQATIDLQRAREAQQMALAVRADTRATADQAYQDQTRAAGLEHDRIVRAGLVAAMGPDGDPSKFDAKAAFQTVSALGRPDALADVIKTHQAMRTAPLFRKPDEQGVDPFTYAPIPGLEATPKIPEFGTPAYEIYLRSQANQAGPGAPASSAAPPPVGVPTYAGRADLLQNGPPPSPVPAGGPGAPSTTAAPPLALAPLAPPAGGPGAAATTTTPPAAIVGAPPAPGAPARALTQNEATLKAYADQRKALEDAKDPHSAAYKEWMDYKAQGGPLAFDAYMTMDANRKRPQVNLGGLNALYADVDPKLIAQAIRNGQEPPDLEKYGKPAAAAIASELLKPDPATGKTFDRRDAMLKYAAIKRLTATLNGTNQVRYDESISSGLAMFDKVDELAKQWDGKGWGPLSQANLAAARAGLKGDKAASLANQLTGQIGQLTSDIATLEQGGLTPTNESRAVAEQSIRDWWGKGTILDMTGQGRYNMQIRHLARGEVQPMVPGDPRNLEPARPATPPGGAAVGTYPGAPATTNTTTRVTQNGVTFDVTRDASGTVISSTVVK